MKRGTTILLGAAAAVGILVAAAAGGIGPATAIAFGLGIVYMLETRAASG